jgi:GDPmannose 4,6-dehydratase
VETLSLVAQLYAGRPRVVVTGAAGQDGYFLIGSLAGAGAEVLAIVRRGTDRERTGELRALGNVTIEECDAGDSIAAIVARVQPDYLFNLAGRSSVGESFHRPELTWQVNADWALRVLEAVREHSPETRVYQASSSEMFGWQERGEQGFDETTPLRPGSPYAAAKASAHMLCDVYRRAYGIRVACGILFNHESNRRSRGFLSHKVASHVTRLRALPDDERLSAPPLTVGNLQVRRDWGYAPEYAAGAALVAAQVALRNSRNGKAEPDAASSYRDYVLGTGALTSVQELVDTAFRVGGIPLRWRTDSNDPREWHALYEGTQSIAVLSDPSLFRAAEPLAICANPARARNELGWVASSGVKEFLTDMIFNNALAGRNA